MARSSDKRSTFVAVDGGGSWRLSETLPVYLENLSPVLSLDIRRAAFAARQAYFVFHEGALTTACVNKGSEVEGFVDIPLQISRSIVALPGAIVSVRMDQLANQQALVTAEKQLFLVQKAYLDALGSKSQYQAPSGAPTSAGTYPAIPNGPVALPADLAAAPTLKDYGKDVFGQQDIAKLCQGTT